MIDNLDKLCPAAQITAIVASFLTICVIFMALTKTFPWS